MVTTMTNQIIDYRQTLRIVIDAYDLEGPNQEGNAFTRAMEKAGLGADCQATPQIFRAAGQEWVPDGPLSDLIDDYLYFTGWLPTPITLLLETGRPNTARLAN